MPKKRYADQGGKYFKNVVFNLCINGAYIICYTIFQLLAHYSRKTIELFLKLSKSLPVRLYLESNSVSIIRHWHSDHDWNDPDLLLSTVSHSVLITRLNSAVGYERSLTLQLISCWGLQQQHIKTAELISSATNRQGDGGQEN